MSSTVAASRRGTIGIITLDNAAKRNCITIEMRYELTETFSDAARDGCTAVVLTGDGGTFSSGGDLASMSDSDRENRARMRGFGDAIRAIADFPAPVIAAVDGPAFGAGLALAAICDLVVASPSARFSAPFSGMGLTADGGLHHSLPARIGLARARRLILTGTVIGAETAAEWGLVDEAVDGPALDPAVALAERLSTTRAPLSLAASKEMLGRTGLTLGDALEAEQDVQVRLMASEDFREGRTAFFEKRSPRFVGR